MWAIDEMESKMNQEDEIKKSLVALKSRISRILRTLFPENSESTGIPTEFEDAHHETTEERLARYRNDARYRFMGRVFH